MEIFRELQRSIIILTKEELKVSSVLCHLKGSLCQTIVKQEFRTLFWGVWWPFWRPSSHAGSLIKQDRLSPHWEEQQSTVLGAMQRDGNAGIPTLHTPAGHTQINKSETRKTMKQVVREQQSAEVASEKGRFISTGGIWEGFLEEAGFELSLRKKKSSGKQTWVGEGGSPDTGNSLNQGLGEKKMQSKLEWWC